ncbi:MAG: hypothetical protein LUQ50_02400 [Methanospirillum sp.]|uniref:hypothetical protein n=1 Tax=Methanospirillum sp. TaxID=45200 RepID=UPI0023742FDE|nr:hypothetical protein [Methanospirillum sp.]MDD1727905.1 hypothetical protein [Methanospirillum sp.]
MTPHRRFLLATLMLTVMIILPVTAEINFTTLPDGSTKISNGTYWIAWERIGPHIVGDTFFVNGTTNLSAGTEIDYTFGAVSADYCHTKICNNTYGGAGGSLIIQPGTDGSPNITSILINSTGFKSDEYYFTFMIISSAVPAEYDAFAGPGFGFTNISLFSSSSNTVPPTSKKAPVPIIVTFGALLGCIGISLMLKKRRRNLE